MKCEVGKVQRIFGAMLLLFCCRFSFAHQGASFLAKRAPPPTKRSVLCPTNSECVPLAACPLMGAVLRSECANSNKIGELGCGFPGSGLVCCPLAADPRTSISAGRVVDGQRCGASQIVGEGYGGVGAFPWAARIGFRNVLSGEVKYPCAGSILSSRVVLTAAHCALARADNFKLFIARIGEFDAASDIDCGEEFCGRPVQDVPISHVIVHPGYKRETYAHNIALLVLRSAVNYTVTSQPICIPESWSVTGNNAMLVGWGKAAGQTATPPEQQRLFLPIADRELCQGVYGQTVPITDEHVCAGGQQGIDACSGFGGAPLIVRHGNTHYQVGILSFGSDQCGTAGIPSVYTNVKKYVTWIRENIPTIYNQ